MTCLFQPISSAGVVNRDTTDSCNRSERIGLPRTPFQVTTYPGALFSIRAAFLKNSTSQEKKKSVAMTSQVKTYIVEHLDEELGPWSELEYVTIAKECNAAGAIFCLSSIPSALELPSALKAVAGFTAETQSVEVLYASDKSRVCLLDPSATKELAPVDSESFDVFLFGGILGDPCRSH